MDPLAFRLIASVAGFVAVYLLVRHGVYAGAKLFRETAAGYDRVLNERLLLDTDPRLAVWTTLTAAGVVGLFAALLLESPLTGVVLGGLALAFPPVVFRHLQQKRRAKLEAQLTDGLVTLSSGTRAGLNLVQSLELLHKNSLPPIQQEVGQILREYQMGLDLNRAMRNASDRIGSHLYRLTFTAIEMHRMRGGDSAESMDRIAESVREIERLEGKLDALTAQGRLQAVFMVVTVPVIIGIYWLIEPELVEELLFTGTGRVLLLIVVGMIAVGFVWIRKILAVDI